jgi:hypothetical protein
MGMVTWERPRKSCGGEGGEGPPALEKRIRQVFSKARAVRVEVRKRDSELGFRERPRGERSADVPASGFS